MYILISFLFTLWGHYEGPIRDPSGQTAYGISHMGPMRNQGCTLHMGSSYGTHICMFAGYWASLTKLLTSTKSTYFWLQILESAEILEWCLKLFYGQSRKYETLVTVMLKAAKNW